MADQTTTSRDVIRAAIEEWNAVELTGVVGPEWDRLAERIDRALFEPRQDGRRWQLHAEIPKALYLTRLGEVMGRGVMADDVPHIAEVLRRAAGQ